MAASALSNFEGNKQQRPKEAREYAWVSTAAKNAAFGEGTTEMRHSPGRHRAQNFVPRSRLGTRVPVNAAPGLSEDQAAAEFSALVLQYSRGDLAQLSDRTKEAAKHWKAGTRAPNCSSLLTMGRRNKRIKEWVIAQMEVELPSAGDEAAAEREDRARLQMMAQMPGQEGAMARAMLKILERGE